MMGWYDDHGMGAWGWVATTLGTVLVLGLLVLVGVLLVRTSRRSPEFSPPPPSPEQLLAERFARGEIDEDEYRRRLATLTTSRAGTAPR